MHLCASVTDVMELLGYLASIFIGITLGLIGGGGSILTVPVLVYLFNVEVVLATAYSLFIVGATSAIGSFSYVKKGLVNFKITLWFGLPSIISVFITREFFLPLIPAHVFTLGGVSVTKDVLLMVLFALLMLLASVGMIKKNKLEGRISSQKKSHTERSIFFQGMLVGGVTGLVGAGGGFLIIPALVKFLHLNIKEAIGTSLVIIALNSLFGFALSAAEEFIQWSFLLKVLILAIVGVGLGSLLSKKIQEAKLKPVFGWFVLVMGIYVVLKELVFR